jgi:hypothetical protein
MPHGLHVDEVREGMVRKMLQEALAILLWRTAICTSNSRCDDSAMASRCTSLNSLLLTTNVREEVVCIG